MKITGLRPDLLVALRLKLYRLAVCTEGGRYQQGGACLLLARSASALLTRHSRFLGPCGHASTGLGLALLTHLRSRLCIAAAQKMTIFMGDEAQSAKDQKTAIAPMLSVRNGVRAIEFYKAAFGAGELFRIDDESSGAVVARLSVGESEFWLADESPEHGNFSPESLGGGSVRMVMIVKDPDAAYERAVVAGANVVWPVSNQPYGWRVGRIVDPFGHHWEIGRPLSDGS